MSPNEVMPARSISAMASCVPSRTKSGLSQRCSAGQMVSRSQGMRGAARGQPAQQAHCRMGVRIDESGQQHMRCRARRARATRSDRAALRRARSPTMMPSRTAMALPRSAVFAGAMGNTQRASISRSADSLGGIERQKHEAETTGPGKSGMTAGESI